MPPNAHKPQDPEPEPEAADQGYGIGPDDLRAGTPNLNTPTEIPTTNPLPIEDSRATPNPPPTT